MSGDANPHAILPDEAALARILGATIDQPLRRTAKILTIDIERLPGTVEIFDQRTRGFIPVTQWTSLPSLLCMAANWYHTSTIDFRAAWIDHADMVKWAWDLYNRADIVVGYNHIGFDNKHLQSEWLLAGMPAPSPWKNVDLYKINKDKFGFESKSLSHLLSRLDLAGKTGKYDAARGRAAMAGDVKAQRLMRLYNQGDVRATKAAYDRLRPWIANHPHIGDASVRCNACGSGDLERNGWTRVIAYDYALYRCKACGANVRTNEHTRASNSKGVA